ncbi:hypothetical protein HK105_203103 [Polyrhizophydium stewartii]|uniref:LITAF domain-containing protein n=1 Tax=Polyrhizophydium stewartii TaxID=2732419 RepID=A0ABR4ND31_9FUNG
MSESHPPPYAAATAPAMQAPAVQVQLQPVPYAQQTQMQVVLLHKPTLSRRQQGMKCPNCQQQVLTNTKFENGLAMWLSVGGCFLLTGVCCWVPCLIRDLKVRRLRGVSQCAVMLWPSRSVPPTLRAQ